MPLSCSDGLGLAPSLGRRIAIRTSFICQQNVAAHLEARSSAKIRDLVSSDGFFPMNMRRDDLCLATFSHLESIAFAVSASVLNRSSTLINRCLQGKRSEPRRR